MSGKKVFFVILAIFACYGVGQVEAQPYKIGTISLQMIVQESKAGQEAQQKLEAKAQELQKNLAGDQQELESLRAEIEKKSSVWSSEIRQQKEREYQKKLRSLQMKQEDAQYELKNLDAKVMGPILQALQEVIAEVGKKEQYTMIMENSRKGLQSKIGLMYADDSIDISDKILAALNAKEIAVP